MNFRGRCHPDMLHSDHQQINKKSKRKQNGQKIFSTNIQVDNFILHFKFIPQKIKLKVPSQLQ